MFPLSEDSTYQLQYFQAYKFARMLHMGHWALMFRKLQHKLIVHDSKNPQLNRFLKN
jgi:hypothetical protein